MYPFRKLTVWHRAHALALNVHEVTERVYRGRYTSLINQMRRASTSIAANIAEGSGQVTAAQFGRYLTIALGSARELDYHVLLAHDLGLLPSSDYARLEARVDQVSRMLTTFRQRVLQQQSQKSHRPLRANQARAVDLTSHISHPTSQLRSDLKSQISHLPSG